MNTGFIYEPPTPVERLDSWRRNRLVPAIVGAASGEPDERERDRLMELARPAAGRVFDQNPTNSCVGMWIAKAIEIEVFRRTGVRHEFSAFAPYYRGRLRGAKTPDRLNDTGMRTSHAVWTVNKHGLPSESIWPSWSLSRTARVASVNSSPPSNRAAFAGFQIRAKVKRIVDDGRRLSVRIADSTKKRQVVGIAIPASGEFRRGTSVVPGGQPLDNWHMVTVINSRINSAGLYEHLCLNSWGDDYGAGGLRWLSEAYVAQSRGTYYVESAEVMT